MSGHGPTRDDGEGEIEPFRQWLGGHIGRLSGIVLGIVTVAAVIFLAAIGYTPAFGLLAVLVIGITLIYVGGRIRNA